jgi:preprotein translocase subunit SecG
MSSETKCLKYGGVKKLDTFEIVSSILLVIASIVLVIIVLMQHGKSAYLGGAIAGGAAETFLGKSKAKTIDVMLSKVTRIIAIVFVVLTLVVNAATIVFRH